jgi:glycerol uptake facilitator-like aquaporin
MSKNTSFVLFTIGFLLTFGAVGGIENDGPLAEGVALAVVGLLIMWVGTLGFRVANSVDNPTLR